MGQVAQAIREKLHNAFHPERLEVIDDSARHAGHSGATPGGESHFNVVIVSGLFEGQGRVARQRSVYSALAEKASVDRLDPIFKALAPGEKA